MKDLEITKEHTAEQIDAIKQVNLRNDEIRHLEEWLENVSMSENALRDGLKQIDQQAAYNKRELQTVGMNTEAIANYKESLETEQRILSKWNDSICKVCAEGKLEAEQELEAIKAETERKWESTPELERGQLITDYYERKAFLQKKVDYNTSLPEEIKGMVDDINARVLEAEATTYNS